jgi:homoserine/homoserine lactone efflux protein
MDPILFTSFIIATLIIVGSPGPAVALASSQAVKHGPRAALMSIFGDALGTITHILIAVFSLKALISSAGYILPFLQIAGGMFILYLAYQTYFSDEAHDAPQINAKRSAFLGGFFSCVTNPKAIVFFVALFPGFISPDLSVGFQSLVYGVVFIVLDALSIFAYAMLAMYLVNSTLAPRINVDKISGLGLFGVGILLIFKGYKELPAT